MAKKQSSPIAKSNPISKRLTKLSKEEEEHLFGALLSPSDTTGPAEFYDFVNHPQHYNDLPNGIECWDVTEHFPGNIAMAIKHLWRVGKKPGAEAQQDLYKAIKYIQRQKKLLAGECGVMSNKV